MQNTSNSADRGIDALRKHFIGRKMIDQLTASAARNFAVAGRAGHGGDLRQRRGRDGGLLRPARRASVHRSGAGRDGVRQRALGPLVRRPHLEPVAHRPIPDAGGRVRLVPWIFLAAINVGTLAACAFVVGLAVAPALITVFGLVADLVESAALTEGLAWVLTGLNVGYGLAAALAGRISDAWGTRAAFGLTIVAATTLALLALRLHASMRKWSRAAVPG